MKAQLLLLTFLCVSASLRDASAAETHRAYIADEVLATAVSLNREPADGTGAGPDGESVTIDGRPLEIAVVRTGL